MLLQVVSYKNHSTYIDYDCFYIDDICVLKSHQKKQDRGNDCLSAAKKSLK